MDLTVLQATRAQDVWRALVVRVAEEWDAGRAVASSGSGAVVDIGTAAILLREKLRLPRWAASVSLAEINGHEAIVVHVEARQARHLHGLPFPRSFEGYPVIVEIRPIAGPN